MKILTAYVVKLEDEEIIDDVESEVILISQSSYQNGSDGNSMAEEFTVAYCMNPETGEISKSRLEHLVVKSYFDEKNKIIVTLSGAKKRI